MTLDMWIAIFILFTAILLFLTEWVRVDVVALGVIIALILTNLLTPQEALSGFSNPAVLTIAALFVVGGAIMQTGLAGAIGRRILDIAGSSWVRLTAVIMVTVALLSAVMSDTGTVAVLLPGIISLAIGAKISPSRLLIPLAYGALLGGATTLIGTPPNIIVSDLLNEQGLTPFGFFDYTPIGLVLLLAGTSFVLLVGRRILPDYKATTEVQRVETPEELVNLYQLSDNLYRLRVRRGSTLIGLTLAEASLRRDFDLNILDISRADQNRHTTLYEDAVSATGSQESKSSELTTETVFQFNDTLIAKGKVTDITQAAARWNLGVQPARADDEDALISNEVGIAEIVLPPRSSLLGKNLVELGFGSRYYLTVLDIQRPGSEGKLNLKDTSLRFGDTLLVQGPWKNILDLRKKRRDFIVMGQPETMVGSPARAKAPLALLILLGMLFLMITNLVPIVAASLIAALAMILTGCVSIDEAYEAVDWKSIVLVAGMIPMSIALEKVGLVNLISEWLINSLGNYGPLIVLAGLFGITSLFTQVLSNTATTVLIAPIGLSAAQKLGIQPYAFMMGIAIAASMAFATPVASPVNTLVMGSGSYRFVDYLKIGVPLILIVMVISILLLPTLWPFY